MIPLRLALPLSALVACLLLPGCSSGTGSSKPSSDANAGGSKSAGHNPGSGKTSAQAPNTIEVSAKGQRLTGIRIAPIETRTVARNLAVPGQIMLDDQRTVHIAPYSDGRVVDVLHNAGDVVRRGEVLAHLHSHAVHETVGALTQDFANVSRAEAALVYAQQKSARYQHLYSIQAASLEQQQTSQQDLVQATTDLTNAQAAVTMEREHLADLLEIQPASITPATLSTYENVPISTPISGTIISRSVTPAMVLEPGTEAYTVSDLHQVWMVAAVSETELAHLHIGQIVTVRSDAWPGQTFPGRITLIGSSLDPSTRTVQVRATLANLRNQLKPLMFTSAAIDEAATRQALFVPEDAIQDINGIESVFITTDGTHFAPRALKTLPAIAGSVEVTDGLRPGERIAVASSFVLKSELLKGTIGEE